MFYRVSLLLNLKLSTILTEHVAIPLPSSSTIIVFVTSFPLTLENFLTWGELLEPEVQAGQGGRGGGDQLLEVELGGVQRAEGNLLVLVASSLLVSPRLTAVSTQRKLL